MGSIDRRDAPGLLHRAAVVVPISAIMVVGIASAGVFLYPKSQAAPPFQTAQRESVNVAAQILDPPIRLKSTGKGATAEVSWDSKVHESPEIRYEIFLDGKQQAVVLPHVGRYVVNKLAIGTHLIQVVAVSAHGRSVPSTVEVTYAPATPPIASSSRPNDPTEARIQPTKSTTQDSVPTPTPASPRIAQRTITVAMKLLQERGYDATLNEKWGKFCRMGGLDGFKDIGLGAPITITDGAGTVIATGKMSSVSWIETSRTRRPRPPGNDSEKWPPFEEWPEHTVVDGYCVFLGRVVVPTSQFYRVQVSHRGFITKSETDLMADKWRLALTLG